MPETAMYVDASQAHGRKATTAAAWCTIVSYTAVTHSQRQRMGTMFSNKVVIILAINPITLRKHATTRSKKNTWITVL